ncbi:hypothetical protein [Spirosoma pollinicola]|uniref:Outer membrane protein beta-barrel domain-containing protein n=1 Tax=Spirosoma pollinicola TaxID=2057025 RepID=A0A2K8YST7_9BACT|nr:hypothetical protein [Spirosoma pollinicola]AUD00695.1 hypothetical protein CWM47_01985 [Spirosoma pollinicola]
MKTDRFSDIIRRKLESIRPEFSEKDWTRMQSSLQTGLPQPATPPSGHPFSGGIWSAKPWLMAAATVSAVVLVGYSFWQHQEINQLRQTMGQLHKQPTHQTAPKQPALAAPGTDTPTVTQAEEKQPQASREELPTTSDTKVAQRGQRDTVYITRYIAVPSKSHVVPPENERSVDRLESPTEQRYVTNNRTPKATAQPNQSDNSTSIPKTDTYGEPSTSPNTTIRKNNTDNSSIPLTEATNQSTRAQRPKGDYAGSRSIKNRIRSTAGSVDKSVYTDETSVVRTPQPQQESTIPIAPAEPQESATSASYEFVTSLPLSTQSTNWNGMLAQQAKRMRPARTTVVSGVEQTKAPESQPVVHVATNFRAGIGGEVSTKVVSAGVFTELLLGKHWAVSAGLSQAVYTSKFTNDYDFDEHMRRNFRKEFARGIEPYRQILNIDTRTTRIQVPITIGYRFPLTSSLTLTPNVGTYLNLSSKENASFYCQGLIPQRGYEELKSDNVRSVELINSLALGAGLEWQKGHWVVQGTPVLTMPIEANEFQPDPSWQKSTTVGLRARVLFQF